MSALVIFFLLSFMTDSISWICLEVPHHKKKVKKKRKRKGQKRYLHLLNRERQMEKKIDPQIYLKKKMGTHNRKRNRKVLPFKNKDFELQKC